MKINFYVPGLPLSPGGGFKIMYEYANSLSLLGHDVCFYSIVNPPYFEYPEHKFKTYLRIIRNLILYPRYRPTWFNLSKAVKCSTVPQLKDFYIRDADVSMATCWTLAFHLNELSNTKGQKINLIQDYEVWIGSNTEKLHDSYRLPIKHVVIADYLAQIVERESGKRPYLVYNAIDSSIFKITNPIEDRDPYTVAMLYSIEERKGTILGIETLKACKKRVPALKVRLFGVYPAPKELDSWMEYIQRPKDLCGLYNSCAIFFTPSNREGWGLPATEAMFSGCALVCTDVDGHRVFAKHNTTALLVKPQDTKDMAEKLMELLHDKQKRIEMAKMGNEFVQQFTWERASNNLMSIIAS